MTDDPSYSAGFLKDFFNDTLLTWPNIGIICICMTPATACRVTPSTVARTVHLFINISGASFFPDALSPHCLKVFVDTDPGYNQIVLSERPAWSENVERWRRGLGA